MWKKNVDNSFDIAVNLLIDLKRRVTIDVSSLANGILSGSFDDNDFVITYVKNKYLLLSCADSNLVKELSKYLIGYIGNISPICEYHLISCDMNVIEWDMIDPEIRIRDIVNNRIGEDSTYDYIKLYNEKNISDYYENDEEQKEYLKNVKTFGIYPGNVDIKDIGEFELFLSIKILTDAIYTLVYSNEKLSMDDMLEMQYGLEYLMYKTKTYGLDVSEPCYPEHITAGPLFDEWYQYYSSYLEQLDESKIEEINNCLKNGESVEKYAPSFSKKYKLK